MGLIGGAVQVSERTGGGRTQRSGVGQLSRFRPTKIVHLNGFGIHRRVKTIVAVGDEHAWDSMICSRGIC